MTLNRRIKRSNADGFTLLEVLIVLAMMLFGLAAISELMNGSLRIAQDTEERTEIQLACQNTLNEIAAGSVALSSGDSFVVPNFPYWSIQVLYEETPLPGLLAVKVSAMKYETIQTNRPANLSPENQSLHGQDAMSGGTVDPLEPGTTRELPIAGKEIVLKQWIRRDAVKTPTVNAGTARDGTDPFAFDALQSDTGTSGSGTSGNVDLFQDAGLSATPDTGEPAP